VSEIVQKSPFSFAIMQTDFDQILKSISTLVEEATFTIDPEGLAFRGMDPSHIALIDIALFNSNFAKFECEKESKFGVKVNELSKLVKQFDKRDQINVEMSKDNELILSNREFKYKTFLTETSATDTPLPKIPYDASAAFYGKTLKNYFKKLAVISQYITLKNDYNICQLSGKGDIGELKIKLERGHEDLIENSVKEDSEGTFSLEYLIPYLQQFSENVVHKLEYSSNKPLRVDSSKIFGAGRMHFYLAPRVENN